MNATTYDRRDDDWETYDPEQDGAQLPRRPRRQFFNKRSAALIAAITCAAGFYAGVRVEKGQVSGSSASGSSLASALAAARGGTSSSGTAGARGASGAAGALGALFGRGGAGGGACGGTSFGTISSVNGKSLFVTTASGNVVKVKLSSATKISKSLNVKRSSLHPGDTVVIRGLTNSKGTITASSVSDSGSGGAGGFGALGGAGAGSGAGTGGGAGSGTTGSASAKSAVGSLFSSGGSGG
jgi:hypothetical protein